MLGEMTERLEYALSGTARQLPRGGAKPLRRRPKRNEALLPNTKGRGGEPPRPPAGNQHPSGVRMGWTEGTAAGEGRAFQSRNEDTRMFRAATAPAKNAVRSSPPGGEGPVGTEGAADAVPIQNSLKKRPFSIMMQNMNPAGFGTRSLWG